MSIRSRLNVESNGLLASMLFYAIAGVIFFVLLPLAAFAPHLGILGIVSLIVAYGITTRRAWTIWLVLIVFFSATVFSLIMIYYSIVWGDVVIGVGSVSYLVLSWVFTIYAASRRRMFDT